MVNACKDSLSSECNGAVGLTSPSYSGILHCNEKTKMIDACRDSRGEFIFSNGKLVAIEFIERNNWAAALNTLVERFGKPTQTVTGAGKLADAIGAIWLAPTSRLSLNGFQNDPSTEPTVCVILQTLSHLAKAGQQQQDSQAHHDDMVVGYRAAIEHRNKDQARLSDDETKHEIPALISSDKMMITMDEGSVQMYELLLANEVREDESADAL